MTMLQASEGCARQTQDNACTGNERYHPDQALIESIPEALAVTVPGVEKLPVGVKTIVWTTTPLTVRVAERPVLPLVPSQYSICTG